MAKVLSLSPPAIQPQLFSILFHLNFPECVSPPFHSVLWVWAIVPGGWTQHDKGCVGIHLQLTTLQEFPRWLSGKESACQRRKRGFSPWLGKIPWRRKWQPPPVFLPGKSHGERSLAVYSLWGRKESDMAERLSMHSQLLHM